jgi:tRNA-splicing ligase RtcB
MMAVKTSLAEISTEALKSIMGLIRHHVPVGFAHHATAQEWGYFGEAPTDIPVIRQELDNARTQLGTLGGGNHFIEIQYGDDGHVWVMIHSGSRNFGLKVATEYHNIAKIQCEKWVSAIPDPDLAFLPLGEPTATEYISAMKYCVDFALANREMMMDRIMDVINIQTGANVEETINIAHNYAVWENHYGQNYLIHRKGATKATLGLRGIIPGSMGAHSYIVEGLGNPESFESCSHGAGRRMGRKEATRTLDLGSELANMTGIIHGLRTVKDLDEAPSAYKDIDVVMENQKDLVKSTVKLIPLANIKG